MKKIKTVVFLSLAFIFSFLVYSLYHMTNAGNDGRNIESPLPHFLTKNFPFASVENNLWEPVISATNQSFDKKLKVTAASAVSYDLTTNRILFAKNVKEKLPIASLTKIMTAIVALENSKPNQAIVVSQKAAGVGENSMGLSQGESLTLEELIYGLILHSGNDAAEAIAEGSRFGKDTFVYLMNKKVEDLGLNDTHFTNPSGLEGDGKQYSTVYDLLVITRYALLNPVFSRIVSSPSRQIAATDKHKAFYLFNETNLLTSYPGVKGVKTGYTDEAGLCLVTLLEYDGHRIIAILLNAENRRQEMKDLLDYSLKALGLNPPPHN